MKNTITKAITRNGKDYFFEISLNADGYSFKLFKYVRDVDYRNEYYDKRQTLHNCVYTGDYSFDDIKNQIRDQIDEFEGTSKGILHSLQEWDGKL